jgi:hypothetical protein
MSTHKTNVIFANDGRWRARCSCKAISQWFDHESDAQDWEYSHQRGVQQARAHLNGRSPSLRDQYDYYRAREQDPDTPDEDRALWKVLADGLAHRIGSVDHTQSLLSVDGGEQGAGDGLT